MIEVATYKTFREMEPDVFAELGKQRGFLNAEYLEAVERAELDCQLRYFVATQGARTVALTVGYIFAFPVALGRSVRVFSGCLPVQIGFPVAFSESGPDRSQVLGRLADEQVAEARRAKAVYVLLRDFCSSSELASGDTVLGARGYRRIPLYKESCIEPGRWGSFEDYLSALGKKYRKEVRRDLRKVLEAGSYRLELLRGPELAGRSADLQRLWHNVYLRHWDHMYLTEQYFASISRLHGVAALVLWRGEHLVAFDLLMERDDTLYATFYGQDYLLTGRDPVSRALGHEILRYAIENGFKRLSLGVGNEALKARFGGLQTQLFGYIQPIGVGKAFRVTGLERLMLSRLDGADGSVEATSADVFRRVTGPDSKC